MLADNDCPQKDLEKAILYLRKAREKKSPYACRDLARIYRDKNQTETSKNYYMEACINFCRNMQKNPLFMDEEALVHCFYAWKENSSLIEEEEGFDFLKSYAGNLLLTKEQSNIFCI